MESADTNQTFVNLYIETTVNAVADLTKNGLIKDTRLAFIQKLVEQKDIELAMAAKKIAELETRPPTEQYAELVTKHEGLMLQKQREHESIVADLQKQLQQTLDSIGTKINALNDIISKRDQTIAQLDRSIEEQNQLLAQRLQQLAIATEQKEQEQPRTKRKGKMSTATTTNYSDTF